MFEISEGLLRLENAGDNCYYIHRTPRIDQARVENTCKGCSTGIPVTMSSFLVLLVWSHADGGLLHSVCVMELVMEPRYVTTALNRPVLQTVCLGSVTIKLEQQSVYGNLAYN
ncbi:hypothetical protein DPMN_149192 [Dreissena polymorpha]|uniref:Uncharacterized protein n=1 Tax=Dreissena polymorpha TaxID=45954 RepID=A0A9D4J531_DREPO|nr:hypothetical protein DPMN_149192 [Dreissena polymorpha]